MNSISEVFAKFSDSFSDRTGFTPFGILVLAATCAGIWSLTEHAPPVQSGTGVVLSNSWEIPAPTDTTVRSVFVTPGQSVASGQEIATLDGQILEAELARVAAEILRVEKTFALERLREAQRQNEEALNLSESRARQISEARVVRAERELADQLLAVAEQQRDWVADRVARGVALADDLQEAELALLQQRAETEKARALDQSRSAGLADSAFSPTEFETALAEFYAAELGTLRQEDSRLRRQLDALTVRASAAGVVSAVAAPGTLLSRGNSVARMVEDRPAELVVYLPATERRRLADAFTATVRAGDDVCKTPATFLRGGAEIVAVPPQLSAEERGALAFGQPMYFSAPQDCNLLAGQVVALQWAAGETSALAAQP